MPETISTEQKDWMLRIANGDENAFRELYDQYQEKVYFLSWKLLNSEKEAKDVLQEIFLKLWLNREKLAAVDSFNAYLNTTIRNHIYDRFRAKAIQEVYLKDIHIEERSVVNTPLDELSLKQLESILNETIENLPPQQKKVFQLSRIEGLKHEQIAQQLGISKETVKKHIMAAVQSIKSKLATYGITLSLALLLGILFF